MVAGWLRLSRHICMHVLAMSVWLFLRQQLQAVWLECALGHALVDRP